MYKDKNAGHPNNAYWSRDKVTKKKKVSDTTELCVEVQTLAEICSNLYSLLQVRVALRSNQSV